MLHRLLCFSFDFDKVTMPHSFTCACLTLCFARVAAAAAALDSVTGIAVATAAALYSDRVVVCC